MKRIVSLLGVLVILMAVTMAFAGDKSTMKLQVGDEIYACNCGETCPCNDVQ